MKPIASIPRLIAPTGTFDSPRLDKDQNTRNIFESGVIANVLKSDISVAKAWISGMPADARKAIRLSSQ